MFKSIFKRSPKQEGAWCGECERAVLLKPGTSSEKLVCPDCRQAMTPLQELSKQQRRDFNLHSWIDEVQASGKWGPSPGGAASDLRCDRTMIDKLSDRGILEKSVYKKDGHYIVMISTRSIEKAKENKAKRGKWTDSGEG